MRLAYRAGVFVWLVGLSGGRFDWGRFLGAQLAGAGVAYQVGLFDTLVFGAFSSDWRGWFSTWCC